MPEVTCEICFKPFVAATDTAITHPCNHPGAIYKPGCRGCACERIRQSQRLGVDGAYLKHPDIMGTKNLPGKPAELTLLLGAAKTMGARWYLAFRLAVNAMLLPHELLAIRVQDLVDGLPCKLAVPACVRWANHRIQIDLDCHTVHALKDWLGSNGNPTTGKVFTCSMGTLLGHYADCLKAAGLYPYEPRALRATGISLRGQAIRGGADLAHLLRCARLKNLKNLLPYLQGGDVLDTMRKVAWAK